MPHDRREDGDATSENIVKSSPTPASGRNKLGTDNPWAQAHPHQMKGRAQVVFAQSGQGTVVAIDAARGKRLWETSVERGEAEHFRLIDLRGPPTIVDDRLFVPSTDGAIHVRHLCNRIAAPSRP